ncbi:bifunctional diaminohydroxyphosphoribosylaminopyrimidine deaminase/5-amino-6-(5-phosphoribosylamino)uracil reductase RibD [Aurantibacter sp.]|uniref:bifunctional diaminohydroxyphosphoribosylaminopyrimidine deaminase/5-amino-6-(5-phosphoribosylamino)uracil reductase RibD n=1 Tax=Aurantibacter sp. TaxID=2807103 RepID=UPI003264648F
MLRCIELGKKGLGRTYPNPMVGSVIVHDDKIIGEGFTSPYGGNHAEVNAISSVRNKLLLKDATIYVSLEPCSHYGKTPPCADLIIKSKIKNVVIGCLDPHEKVAGKGIKRLRDAGCNVEVGILEQECRKHHKRFLTFHEKKRPYIILKWAETADGFIAPANELRANTPEPFWITNKKSRQLVHQWRSEEHAILVGTNTVLSDNPKLNVRDWTGNSPIRIVIDRKLKIPKDYFVFDESVRTIIINSELNKSEENLEYIKSNFKNLAQEISKVLHQKNISSIIIEGGSYTLLHFIKSNLWDEARVFTGTSKFKNGLKAPEISGSYKTEQKVLNDTLTTYYND